MNVSHHKPVTEPSPHLPQPVTHQQVPPLESGDRTHSTTIQGRRDEVERDRV